MFDSEIFEFRPESCDRLDLSDAEWALLDLPVEVGRPGIPEGLDSFGPGRAFGVVLSTIDVNSVSGAARVSILRAHQKLASHYEAVVDTDMAAISDDMVEPGDGLFSAEEFAALEKHGWTYTPIEGGDYLLTSRLGLKYTNSGRPPP